MKKVMITLFVLASILTHGYAQDNTTAPVFGIKISGFIKTDAFYDTRQVSPAGGIREGHFYLFPDNELLDASGKDLNANPSFSMLSIQTRVRGDIAGPDAFGAKTSGVLETEFFGTSEGDMNSLRLRHGYVKLDWEKSSLIVGQTWHPMFPAECTPGTVSFNTGAPFTPFARNPQVRYTHQMGIASLQATAYTQRDFTSTGPDGSSSKYMRNAAMPALNLLVTVKTCEAAKIGVGVDYKTIRPEIKTSKNYTNEETLSSMSFFGWLKVKTAPVSVSLMGVMGQNMTDLVMLGGYAVKEVTDTTKGLKTFTNLKTLSALIDIKSNGKNFQAGFFGGYSSNLGSVDPIGGAIYARGANVDHLIRYAPRVMFTREKLTFAAELEMTTAAYGTPNKDGKVENTKDVTNTRLLLSAIYKF